MWRLHIDNILYLTRQWPVQARVVENEWKKLPHRQKYKHSGSISRNACVACETYIAMRDYQESVTTGQTDRHTDGRTDRQTPDKVIPTCRYASQATQKWYIQIIDYPYMNDVNLKEHVHVQCWIEMRRFCFTSQSKMFQSYLTNCDSTSMRRLTEEKKMDLWSGSYAIDIS